MAMQPLPSQEKRNGLVNPAISGNSKAERIEGIHHGPASTYKGAAGVKKQRAVAWSQSSRVYTQWAYPVNHDSTAFFSPLS